MKKIFLDTNVALDVLLVREPHYPPAASLFSLIEKGALEGYLSSLTFSNLAYILQKTDQRRDSIRLLQTLRPLVHILPVTSRVIDLALASGFKDFEDAVQYYTALEGHVPVLVTRNIRDFSKAEITVCTPDEFLKTNRQN
jgi:predicted nucleic acid-binding protein